MGKRHIVENNYKLKCSISLNPPFQDIDKIFIKWKNQPLNDSSIETCVSKLPTFTSALLIYIDFHIHH